MTNETLTGETIVAVYETAAHADAAVRDLQAANVPSRAISREPSASEDISATAPRQVREQGFWSGLFGGEPDHDTAVYDRSVDSGSHVVTVKVPEAEVANVTAILERHNPVDLDDRAAGYGLGGAATAVTPPGQRPATTAVGQRPATTAAGQRPATTATGPDTTALGTGSVRGTATREGDEVIPLAEERINVGKRLVNRGTTRVRRFVVETPVEENVTLRSERVSIDRRPVAGDAVAAADFTDKTIEVTESDEEAVVDKTARVKEEVVVRKDVSDRVETVRDKVRREDVEITKSSEKETAASRRARTIPSIDR